MEGETEGGSAGGRRKLVGGKRKNMCLEDYIDFFDSRNSLDLTVNFLLQVIRLHGFRLCGVPKKMLADGVNTLNLIDPCRSTLNEKAISSAAATLTLEEVKADLENLKWQECCVASLQILNAEKETPASSSSAAAQTALATADPKPNKKKQGRKKKPLDLLEPDGSDKGMTTKKKNRQEDASGNGVKR